MSDSLPLDGVELPNDDDELAAVLQGIDDVEVIRNMFLDFAKSVQEVVDDQLAAANFRLDALEAIPIAKVQGYFQLHEKRLKQKRHRNKFGIGIAEFTVLILKRSLITTKEQDKALLDIVNSRPWLKRFTRPVPDELDREKISSGPRSIQRLVASVGGRIGRRQKTTVKTPNMRKALLIEERPFPNVKD